MWEYAEAGAADVPEVPCGGPEGVSAADWDVSWAGADGAGAEREGVMAGVERLGVALRGFRREYLAGLLEETKGHLGRAARLAGVHRNTLTRQMQAAGVVAPQTSTRRKSCASMPKKRKVKPVRICCPECRFREYRVSAVNPGMVRCMDCYLLYTLPAAVVVKRRQRAVAA